MPSDYSLRTNETDLSRLRTSFKRDESSHAASQPLANLQDCQRNGIRALRTIGSQLALNDMNRRMLRLKLWQTYRIAKGMPAALGLLTTDLFRSAFRQCPRTIANHSFVRRFYFLNLHFFD